MPPANTPRARLELLDVLRGLAVVLMIHTHVSNAWVSQAARAGRVFALEGWTFALPSRLFLLLLGASLAAAWHRAGGDARALRLSALRRAAELVALGFALRLHDWWSHGMSEPLRLWKVDILPCLGLSALVCALLASRAGRPAPLRAVAAAAAAVVLGAWLGGEPGPAAVPAPAWAYVAGPRPLAWFPLLPWCAFALAGVWAGDLLVRRGHARDAGPLGAALLALGAGAAALSPAGPARWHDAEADPRTAVALLGALLVVAAVTARALPWLPAPLRAALVLLGKGSLPIYVVHLGIVYGKRAAVLEGRLGLPGAALGTLSVTVAMMGFAWAWARASAAIRGRTLRLRP